MKIIKIYNNNTVSALSPELGDVILTGSGIGFKKKTGDIIDPDKIEKTYLYKENQEMNKEIDPLFYEIADHIVSYAIKKLHTKFYGEIFTTISNHISLALKRQKASIHMPHYLSGEVEVLYKDEYDIGRWAIGYIRKKTGILLDDTQACYIALYLVNFSIDHNKHQAVKIMNFVKEILEIIEKYINKPFSSNSSNYARLSIHLKYLAERIFMKEIPNSDDTTKDIRNMLEKNKELSLCIKQVDAYIKDVYKYKLSPDERTFLCMHMKYVMS